MLQTINGFQILRKVAESNTAEIFHVLRLVGRGRGEVEEERFVPPGPFLDVRHRAASQLGIAVLVFPARRLDARDPAHFRIGQVGFGVEIFSAP